MPSSNSVHLLSVLGVLLWLAPAEAQIAGRTVVLSASTHRLVPVEQLTNREVVVFGGYRLQKTKRGTLIGAGERAEKVVQTETRTAEKIVKLFGNAWELEVTLEHPFFVHDKKDFVAANALSPGMIFASSAGKTPQVLERVAQSETSPTVVFNFEVERTHNYFVSAGILVHNSCAPLLLGMTIDQRTHTTPWTDLVSYQRSRDRPMVLITDFTERVTDPNCVRAAIDYLGRREGERIYFNVSGMWGPASRREYVDALEAFRQGAWASTQSRIPYGFITNVEFFHVMSQPDLRAVTRFFLSEVDQGAKFVPRRHVEGLAPLYEYLERR